MKESRLTTTSKNTSHYTWTRFGRCASLQLPQDSLTLKVASPKAEKLKQQSAERDETTNKIREAHGL